MNSQKRLLYKPPPIEDYTRNYCKLIIVIIISFVFISAEFVAGFISGSIAVISDAFHLVTDLIGFVISFIFIYISRRQPTQKMSFGYHRMELIGALGNLFIIWVLALFMIEQATMRIINKQFVSHPLVMLIVGVGGLAINIIMYFILHSGSHSHGLMAQQCDHHHEPHDNQPINQNCTNSFCSELICQDQICLKQVNYLHCHTTDPKGETKIHIHDSKRKISDQIIDKSGNVVDQFSTHQMRLKNMKNQSNNGQYQQDNNPPKTQQHGPQCKHDHKIVSDKTKQQSHSNKNKKHAHIHKQGQQCKHQNKNQHRHQNKHQHTQGCMHDHEHENQRKSSHKHLKQKQSKHQHGENCKHDHGNKHGKNKSHSHPHDHEGHSHHNHQNQHQGHDHNDQGHSHQSISMKAAVLHAFSDVIQSIGLLISSLFIFFLGSDKGAQVHQWNNWHYFDPISTYVFSIIVIISTIPIVKNCYFLIMQATPSTQAARQLKKLFQQASGVVDVHDLHVWDLKPGKTLLTAHVFAKQGAQRQVLTNLTQICRKKKIYHSTFQVEQQNWRDHAQYILCDHDIH